MVTNLREYRKKKQTQLQNIEMIKIPVYKSIYKEGNKIIGQSPRNREDIIKDFDKEGYH